MVPRRLGFDSAQPHGAAVRLRSPRAGGCIGILIDPVSRVEALRVELSEVEDRPYGPKAPWLRLSSATRRGGSTALTASGGMHRNSDRPCERSRSQAILERKLLVDFVNR